MRDKKVFELVLMASLITMVIVLQMISSFMKIAAFDITLVLIPIAVGAIILGVKSGAILGFVFGFVVSINCITGFDTAGHILYNASPIATIFVCLLKGTIAGMVPALVFNLLKKRNFYVAIILAASLAPVANTLIFVIAMPLFFHDTLVSWAAGANLMYFTIFVLIGTNFLIEFFLNLFLSPTIVRIIKLFNDETDSKSIGTE